MGSAHRPWPLETSRASAAEVSFWPLRETPATSPAKLLEELAPGLNVVAALGMAGRVAKQSKADLTVYRFYSSSSYTKPAFGPEGGIYTGRRVTQL